MPQGFAAHHSKDCLYEVLASASLTAKTMTPDERDGERFASEADELPRRPT